MENVEKCRNKVMPVVASVAMARMMERCGADAVIAEGTEAGGHIGEITTMVLVPQVVDAVNIPVVAAGGIADGEVCQRHYAGSQWCSNGNFFCGNKRINSS